jgi:hypothetical protein
MPQLKRSHGVRVPNSQRRQFFATQILLVKIAIICFAGGGCTVEIIDACCEKPNNRKLKKNVKRVR